MGYSSKFVWRVTALMRRATREEKEIIAAELEAHVADHIQALVEGGMDLQEAQNHAEAAMGDPHETAQALDAQLSPFWLWAGRVLKGCAIALGVLLAVFCLGSLGEVRTNLEARWGSGLYDYHTRYYETKEGYAAWDTDFRLDLGSGDVLRITRVYLSPAGDLADVQGCLYDKNPFGRVTWGWTGQFWAKNDRGEWQTWGVSGDLFYDSVFYMTLPSLPVEPGQERIDLEYRRFGKAIPFQVPLTGEVEE